MKFILLLLIFPVLQSQIIVKVIGVKDGDTISVLDTATRILYSVRLAEIDCPEKNQPFGSKANQITSDLVFGKYVKLESIGKDRNGRTIGKVYYDDSTYLSETLIKTGMAWVFRKYSKNAYLIRLEADAKNNKVGLWFDESPIEPSVWRKGKRN